MAGRAVAAIALVLLGWWLLFQFAERYNPGGWYGFIGLGWVFLGPAVGALVAAAPAFRGGDVTRAGLSAAFAPALAWYWWVGHGSSDGHPVWIFVLPAVIVVVLVGAVTSWCLGTVLDVIQDESQRAA
jgi:hypothetical protein